MKMLAQEQCPWTETFNVVHMAQALRRGGFASTCALTRRHKDTLPSTTCSITCLWQYFPRSRALPDKSEYLGREDRYIHDPDIAGRCGYKLDVDGGR